ncbi:MAG: FtsH protease activity modulator HflK [Alphaproteobacteria bacterium]|nr:FtsH protease activity modulator HflK [Alphaproteobacteria bacterium]MCY4319070.1 FtsH protease activity modulator HflK [Alphaproteobacteria bacterium]
MPWQNQGSGGPWGGGGGGGSWGGGGGPWGGGGNQGGSWGGGRGGGPQAPNVEEAIRRLQDWLRRRMPGGGAGGRGGRLGILLVVVVLLAIWVLSGFYRVQTDEQGVVLRFGERVGTTTPGLNYHLPYPIESVEKPKVTRVNRVEVGFRSAEEALMLTGDENIVDINFVVFWVIKDAGDYLFNVREPERSVKAAAESVMREIVGQTPIAAALAEGRGQIEAKAQEGVQRILDDYSTGIAITNVQLLKADPPNQVVDAFRDVQRARADQERLRNEAEAYANDIIPRARGEAERLVQEAEAYKQEVVARSEGDAQRFTQVYTAFRAAKDVTTKRIYLETMEEIFSNAEKYVIDQSGGASGVVPYLPLPEVQRRIKANEAGGTQSGTGDLQ